MTITEDTTDATDLAEDNSADEVENEGGAKRGRKRDFTKSSEHYDNLTEFVNGHEDWTSAGLGTVTPLQVKAILALRTDFNNTPEQVALREQRKAEKQAEEAKYDGLSKEQIKAQKLADRAEKQAEKLQEKAREALEKAQALKAQATGSAEDLQAVVESEQDEADEPKKRRGLRR